MEHIQIKDLIDHLSGFDPDDRIGIVIQTDNSRRVYPIDDVKRLQVGPRVMVVVDTAARGKSF